MSDIIGIIVAWASEDWIGPAIEQARLQCDDLYVCISSHTKQLDRFADRTLDIANSYIGLKMVEHTESSYHAIEKATILNTVMSHVEVGQWIWIRDVDEFYDIDTYSKIRNAVNSNLYDAIETKERYFYINMQHYLKSYRCRLYKKKHPNDKFVPTQQWRYANNIRRLDDCYMFHYGMLTNPVAKMEFWKSEYPNKSQQNKVKWIDCIYRNYDLKNQEYWTLENYRLFGIKSPWFSNSFVPDRNGYLFEYSDKHPQEVQHLVSIEDFRKVYDYK